MSASRIQRENRVLSVLDAVTHGRHVEDSAIELKSDWPSPEEAARRIAAHANAARGEQILWLLGVDEQAQTVPGLATGDLATWWAQVARRFDDGWTPRMEDLIVPYGGVSVMGLFMDTAGAPFVVKTGDEKVSREVPWRHGTRTRSAQRGDLVRLLAPVAEIPEFEVLASRVAISQDRTTDESPFLVYLDMRMYVTPRVTGVVFPFHRVVARVTIPGEADSELSLNVRRLGATRTSGTYSFSQSSTITSSDTEVVVSGPGMLVLDAQLRCDPFDFSQGAARAVVSMQPAGSDLSAVIAVDLPPTDARGNDIGRWGSWAR